MKKFGFDNFERRSEIKADYSLQSSAGLLRAIQAEYEKFETPENQRRKKALQEIFDEFEKEGHRVAVFFGGSLAAGQSIEASDIEVKLLANESAEQEQTKLLLSERIHQKLGEEVEVDFWGQFVDLLRAKEALDEIENTGSTQNLSGILDLYFAFQLSHLRMGVDCQSLISKIESLRYKSVVLNNSLNALNENRLLNKKRFFAESFRKYRDRLKNNPNFSSLSEEEQRKVTDRVDILERQFVNF